MTPGERSYLIRKLDALCEEIEWTISQKTSDEQETVSALRYVIYTLSGRIAYLEHWEEIQ